MEAVAQELDMKQATPGQMVFWYDPKPEQGSENPKAGVVDQVGGELIHLELLDGSKVEVLNQEIMPVMPADNGNFPFIGVLLGVSENHTVEIGEFSVDAKTPETARQRIINQGWEERYRMNGLSPKVVDLSID